MALSSPPVPHKLSLLRFWTTLYVLLFQKKKFIQLISIMMMIIMVYIEQNTFHVLLG